MFFRSKNQFPDVEHSVLFVCMGNICRSPAGEGVFKHYVDEQGQTEQFFIDSAGTTGAHAGQSADERMQHSAQQRGYVLDSLARKVKRDDISNFDLIIAMDFDNLMNLRHLAASEPEHVRLLGSFLPGQEGDSAPSVPDPYYGGQQGFERVLDMIEEATPAIYQYLLKQK